jgi:hypothetical protein
VPGLGARVTRLALRGSGHAALDETLVPVLRGGFEPGGLTDALHAEFDEAAPAWNARYRVTAHGAAEALASGGTKEVRVRRRVRLCEDLPAALVEAEAWTRRGRRAAPYGLALALRPGAEGDLVFRYPRGDAVGSWRAVLDPPIHGPMARGNAERLPPLAAGALVAQAGEEGATVLFTSPARPPVVHVLPQRFRATATARFAPDRAGHALAIVRAERVAVGPCGVLAAATTPARRRRVRVALVLRDLDAAGPLEAAVAGARIRLEPRSLGGAGAVHAGSAEVTERAWRRGAARVRVAGGEYVA